MQKLICSALAVALVAHVASAADYNVTWRGNVDTSIATPANWAHDWNAEPVITGLPDAVFASEVPSGDNLAPVINSNGQATLASGEAYSGSWLLINEWGNNPTLTIDGGTLELEKQLMIGRYGGRGTFEMKNGTATVGALDVAHWTTERGALARFTGGEFTAKSFDWTGGITVGLQSDNTRGEMIIDGGKVVSLNNVTVARAQMWANGKGVDDGFPEEDYWALSNTLTVVSGELAITNKLLLAVENRSVGLFTLSNGVVNMTGSVQMSNVSNALSRLTIAGGEFNMTGGEVVLFSEDWQGSDVDKSYVKNSVAEVVLDGGVLKTKRIRRHPTSAGKARITFNGGTLQPIDSRTDFLDVTSFDSVMVAEGGIVIDTAGHDVTISGDFTGVGGLTKKGAGTLKVANGRTWSGATTVLEGTLDLNNAGDPIDDTLVVSSAGTVVNAVVTPENVEFRGGGTISLLSYGTTYGDYTAGSIKIAGGSVKIPNRFNALLYDADAHYDPSVADSLTTDADGKVTKVANLGKLGSAMDAAAYDATNVATVSSAAKINDLTALSFANNYGYASAGTVNIADNQGRTMFSVGCRSNIGDNAQMFHIGYHNCILWDGLGATAIHQLPWGDYSIRFIACCETNGYASTSWDLYWYGNNYGNMLDQVNVFDMRCTGEKLEGNNAFRVNGEWKSGSATVLASDFESFKLIGGTEHVVLGYRDGNRTPSSGLLGETLAYSRALSDTERDDVKAYLQNKWVDANVATAAVGETGVATLALAENAAVDFDGAPVVIENLVGGGAITGGTGYTITGSITIEVGEDGAIVPAVFDGPVTIGEGVVLNIVGAVNLLKEKVVFLSVSNGAISGKIASASADDGKAASAVKTGGTSYGVIKGTIGFAVFFR